MIQVTVGGE